MDMDKRYIKKLIGSGAAILEVGSYNGKDGAELAEICETEVHCFEPNPASYEIMKLLRNPALVLWNYAVTAHDGFTILNLSNHPQSDTIKRPKLHKKIWPKIKYKDEIKVKCTTLDSWNFHVRNDKPIDFIWCDVNGSEDAFLVGARNTLAVTKYLYIEFCVVELFDRALDKNRMVKSLPGFELMGEYNVGPSYGNLLFRNIKLTSE